MTSMNKILRRTFLLPALAVFLSLLPRESMAQTAGKRAELAELAVEWAESEYKLRPTEDKKYDLISAYEKLIALRCMPDLLKTMRYENTHANKSCDESVEKLLTLWPTDSVAICARDGIDSESCKDAAQDQAFIVLSKDARRIGLPDLDAKLAGDRGASVEADKRDKAIDPVRQEYQKSKSPEKFQELAALLRDRLGEHCAVQRISFKPIKENSSKKELSPLGLSRPRPSKPKREVPGPMQRVIEVPDSCYRMVTKALQIDPYFPEAVCIKHGHYSPACLDAVRRWSKAHPPQGAAPKAGRTGPGFETF